MLVRGRGKGAGGVCIACGGTFSLAARSSASSFCARAHMTVLCLSLLTAWSCRVG